MNFRPRIVLRVALVLLAAFSLGGRRAAAQSTLPITFRYVHETGSDVVRAYLPGAFNDWGPNQNGLIQPDAPSLMTFVDSLEQWLYTTDLQVGQTYQYKVHLHLNADGSSNLWLTDPLNPRSNPADNNNSVLTVTDPLVFQAAHERNDDGLVGAVSAGLFGSSPPAEIRFWINDLALDGLPFYNPETGIFRYALERPVRAGTKFKIRLTDAEGRRDSLEIGSVQPPITWGSDDFNTVRDQVTLSAFITRADGTVDSLLTEATLVRGDEAEAVAVANGAVEALVDLDPGVNAFLLQATVEAEDLTSDTLRVTRRLHPLDAGLVTATVSGTGFAFQVDLTPTDLATGDLAILWTHDETAGTVDVSDLTMDAAQVTGVADGPGEAYFNVSVTDTAGREDHLRVAVVVEAGGTARAMAYEETPSWVNRAVVYEIFPLSFGPEATGSEAMPGTRFDEITAELDYIAGMGYTVLWFMPIMKNQFLDQISGGYNITDFNQVDPKYGTNDDFKALVERAHELGLKVILDITPNHASPVHPWVDALRATGPEQIPGSFIQTTPSPHDRGLDDRGPNLPEVWQIDGGVNLYRKYDGFGDLANLDWDDDDLQATFLDILAYWVREFDIDGWRFDVYWGPWRRYGPDRFGQPIREWMKRIKPDSWLLGEIAGTGVGTEVYYADDDNGTAVVGGIDAGYDWTFYFDGVRGTYGDLANYDQKVRNGDFWPGPNARFFRFLENHDEPRIAKQLGANPDRVFPLTGLLLTTTGVPMVYQGQEVNFGDVGGDERRVSVDWETERNGEFARFHQELNHARTRFPAFWTQDHVTLNASGNVYAFVRPYLDENAVVLVNFAGSDQTITVNPTPVLQTTTDGPVTYTDLFADTTFTDAELDGFSVTVSPYETVVFIGHAGDDLAFDVPPVPPLPFGAVNTNSDAPGEAPVETFRLDAAYPNPFTTSATIRYTLPGPGRVRLDVYDVLGRRVARLVDTAQGAGEHTVSFTPDRLPGGLYFYRLDSEHGRETRSFVYLR